MSQFSKDVRNYLLEKINPPLPEEFLRKWLNSTNKEVSEEAFDKEIPLFLRSMKWDLISSAFIKSYDLKIEEQDIIDFAKIAARRQFVMYGMRSVPDETLTQYATSILKDEKSIRALAAQAIERKIALAAVELADVTIQELSPEEFNQMLEEANIKENEEFVKAEEVGDVEEVDVEETEVEKAEETTDIEEVNNNIKDE